MTNFDHTGTASSGSTTSIDDVDPLTFFIPKPSSQVAKNRSPSAISSLSSSPSSSAGSTKASSSSTFDYDEPSDNNKFGSFIQSMTSSLPQLRLPRLRRFRQSSGMDDSGWSDDEEWTKKRESKKFSKSPSSWTPTKVSPKKSSRLEEEGGLSQINDLLDRNNKASTIARKGTFNLLSSLDMKKVSKIGKDKAVLDLMSLGFTVLFLQELKGVVSSSLTLDDMRLPSSWDGVKSMLQLFMSGIAEVDPKDVLSSWAPYALAAALLSRFTMHVLYDNKVLSEAAKLSKYVASNVFASQLYLRLVSGQLTKKQLPSILGTNVGEQFIGAVEIARLRSFVFMALVVLAATVSVVKPILTSVASTLIEIASLNTLREWPVDWESLGTTLKELVIPLGHKLIGLLEIEVKKIIENPIAIASTAYLCATLVAVTQVPTIGRYLSSVKYKGTTGALNSNDTKEERSLEAISNMGISSARRLQLQSNDGAIEEILSRLKNISRLKQNRIASASNFVVQKLGYVILISFLLTMPVVLHLIIQSDGAQFNFLSQVLLLIYLHDITRKAVFTGLKASKDSSVVSAFTRQLLSTVNEVKSSMMRNPHNDLHLTATASPTKGISVSDLWAAHVTKRAWACRGANLTCKSGEIVLILGDDSSGKTRLLTAISEAIFNPPKRSRSTTLARGKIAVGGLETVKWEKSQLKRRIGILLNDPRNFADICQLYSGSTLADILQPVCPDIPKPLRGPTFVNAVNLASKLSGISTTLIDRLPSKLSSVVTANEDELSKLSNVDPMSAAEWSKICLTKVLAQAIACNDNPLASSTSVARSLVGSVLLLDDVTAYMDEVEEAQFVKTVRSTGAATILTSKRWALGRLVDRVVVLKNGSVIESGTHAALLAKGSLNSIYAKKWAQITAN
mmetsp:Transcript_25491/g.38133  ORF Transcript_25491/g.38133 Transcript_25491/m.38133 type:complete len:905 (+) Transcript_25491:327-3041(+)